MRISDWSSDVCSSDLLAGSLRVIRDGKRIAYRARRRRYVEGGDHAGRPENSGNKANPRRARRHRGIARPERRTGTRAGWRAGHYAGGVSGAWHRTHGARRWRIARGRSVRPAGTRLGSRTTRRNHSSIHKKRSEERLEGKKGVIRY